MSGLRALGLRECKSVVGLAFAERQTFSALHSLDMERCFAFSMEGEFLMLLHSNVQRQFPLLMTSLTVPHEATCEAFSSAEALINARRACRQHGNSAAASAEEAAPVRLREGG